MSTSLLDKLRSRYLETIRSVKSRWKVLVVDERAHELLTSVLTTYDILEEGVQQVDLITTKRTAQPRLACVYVLAPTTANVEAIMGDYSPALLQPKPSSRRSKDAAPPEQAPPKYAEAHVYFLDGISDPLVHRLTSALPANYLLALTELYLNFTARESRVFTIPSTNSFQTLFGPPQQGIREAVAAWQQELAWISRGIINVLASLGEYPLVRFYEPPPAYHAPLGPAQAFGQHLSRCLAIRVQNDLDFFARSNRDFPPVEDPPRPRGVLMITDRSMDLFAPFLHEFTYQAMCNDVLDIMEGKQYRYSFRNAAGVLEDKQATLSEDDKVWTALRHEHMRDALEKISADFKKYAGDHAEQFDRSGQTSLNDMKDMLASLPQLTEAKDKLSLHLSMAQQCMSTFERRKLAEIAHVEQCCATGLDPDGKATKGLVEEMVPLLDDRSLSTADKVRIIASYILHRDGVGELDRKRLYQHARLTLRDMDAIDNLTRLGANVTKDTGKKRKPLFKQRAPSDAYDISRYQHATALMLEELFQRRLDSATFPLIKDSPGNPAESISSSRASVSSTSGSLRSSKPQWVAKKPVNEPRQRVIVFCAGGLTYGEVRAAYTMSGAFNKEIYIGSTDIYRSEDLIQQLSRLGRGSYGNEDDVNYDAVRKKLSGKTEYARCELMQGEIDRRFAELVRSAARPESSMTVESSTGAPAATQPAPRQDKRDTLKKKGLFRR